jgi:hypothetical protein
MARLTTAVAHQLEAAASRRSCDPQAARGVDGDGRTSPRSPEDLLGPAVPGPARSPAPVPPPDVTSDRPRPRPSSSGRRMAWGSREALVGSAVLPIIVGTGNNWEMSIQVGVDVGQRARSGRGRTATYRGGRHKPRSANTPRDAGGQAAPAPRPSRGRRTTGRVRSADLACRARRRDRAGGPRCRPQTAAPPRETTGRAHHRTARRR